MHPNESVAGRVQSIADELGVVLARPERVEAECASLRAQLGASPDPAVVGELLRLVPFLSGRADPVVEPVFALLEQAASACADPWPLLEGMLAARDGALARRALALAERLAASGALDPGERVARGLAGRLEVEGGPLGDAGSLRAAGRILRGGTPVAALAADPVLALYLGPGPWGVRRLAARVLDLEALPAPPDVALRLLGPAAQGVLRPYLEYTRASHLDLLHLAPAPGKEAPVLDSLRAAEAVCGEALLRSVIAELGWPRASLGLDARHLVGISLGGPPLWVQPSEAPLLEACPGARRTGERFLVLAHGGLPPGGAGRAAGGDDPVPRFRAYNLAHAEALADILDVAPLDERKVGRLVARMDRITSDFALLFARFTQEGAILPDVYRRLREEILSRLEAERGQPQLSADLTRLVQMFEDPPSLGQVRTLHGLKRYLHQQGLRLGFRLVEAGRSTNRAVSVVLASPARVLRTVADIGYVDFDPEEGAAPRVPYPVLLLAEGFGLQLLHGQEGFPGASVFCYGNEVHYYIAYGNHPAFLRVDYAPPLSGGMIDLEYYGVSKYVLSDHPNPELDAVRAFFRRLDFDIQIRNTHVHARYDKERAVDLEALCEKAEAVFRLLPHLMDLDWTIGDLRLDAAARRKVIDAWAERFASWGVVPAGRILTRDRQGILVGTEAGAGGERENRWSGAGEYHDCLGGDPSPSCAARLAASLAELGLDPPAADPDGGRAPGQVALERGVLRPLREALARGELYATPEGPRRRPAELFQREHEAEAFAEILEEGGEELAAAERVARLVLPLERSLRFRTTGSVNGHEVQRARVALRGGVLGLYVLRDGEGMIRLALHAPGEGLWRRRGAATRPWTRNRGTDAAALASLLRRNSYLSPDVEPAGAPSREGTRALRDLLRRPSPLVPLRLLPGERVVAGLRVSPGRAAGVALFGTAGRRPAEFEGAVLVAEAVRPEDSPFLARAAGVVSTGGGALSHAGLIATQFGKPALIVPGRWSGGPGGAGRLLAPTQQYDEEERRVGSSTVRVRTRLREVEHAVREGDLIVLDADGRAVHVLGQDRDVLALHEGLLHFGDAGRRLAAAPDEAALLALRGRRLAAGHQVEKLLGRLRDAVVARHAAREILLGEPLAGAPGGTKGRFLSILLGNRAVAGAVREALAHLASELARRRDAARAAAARRIPASDSLYEVLTLRLEALHLERAIEEAADVLASCGLGAAIPAPPRAGDLDRPARSRLRALRAGLARAAGAAAGPGEGPAPGSCATLRHLARQIERVDLVLGAAEPARGEAAGMRARLETADREARAALAARRVLPHESCGFEIFERIGWKAANLGEVERLADAALVPPWFVLAHEAFEAVLRTPAGPGTLREAIDAVLARGDLDAAGKAARVRALWEEAPLPESLAEEVRSAYRGLGGGEEPFVAVRSSACEEDTEAAARAGEFDTFLFVRGEESVLEHVRRAWSGLWNARAILNRALLGARSERVGGGVIVQRVVDARVSGVLQTVNLAEGELREIVVNAGLGLGEGVVSGTVAADQVVVARDSAGGRGPLRFRYLTADKRERVVFDRRAGSGTVRAECLYHQRLRPALEYTELCELVAAALGLEAAYGYPLDIEFALEGIRLWILQVRPVAAFRAALHETLERHPLAAPPGRPASTVPTEEIRP